MTERSLQFVLDQRSNKSYWKQPEFGRWKFNGWSVRQDSNDSTDDATTTFIEKYKANSRLEYDHDAEYINFGKGYP